MTGLPSLCGHNSYLTLLTTSNVFLFLLLERRHLKSQIQSYSRPSWFNFGNLCRDLGQWDCYHIGTRYYLESKSIWDEIGYQTIPSTVNIRFFRQSERTSQSISLISGIERIMLFPEDESLNELNNILHYVNKLRLICCRFDAVFELFSRIELALNKLIAGSLEIDWKIYSI